MKLRSGPVGERPYVVATQSLDHAYVDGTVAAVTEAFPYVRFVPRPAGLGVAKDPIDALWIQWIDFLLRQNLAQSLIHAAKLLAVLSVARMRGIRVLWTCHNLMGKGHDKRALDRLLRAAMVLLVNQCIVLDSSAIPLVERELLPGVRGRFRKKVAVVPHPLFGSRHGEPLDKRSARQKLGIEADEVIAFLPMFSAQARFEPPDEGFPGVAFLEIDPSSASHDLVETGRGWLYRGRPDDHTYGTLLCAADIVMLTDPRALGSGTLHTAVWYGRPVISPACPAVEPLRRVGGAAVVDDWPDLLEVPAKARGLLDEDELRCSFDEFTRRSSPAVIAEAMAAALGLPGATRVAGPVACDVP